MRIISSFRDYYDPIQAYDEDRETEFHREKKIITINSDILSLDKGWYDLVNAHYPRIIGFCGKIYRFYYFDDSCNDYRTNYRIPNTIEWVYNPNEVLHNLSLSKRGKKALESKNFNKHFAELDFTISDVPEALKEYNIFYAKRDTSVSTELVINPCLMKYKFFRIKDINTTYQELRMWIENQARPEKPIPFIDDKTMAEAKGFDKYSFRKDKSR